MDFDPAIIPTQLNPDLTPELAQEVSFFLKWGYLVVADALTAEQVEALRAALDETVLRTEGQFTHQLLEEDDRFAFLLDNPPVLTRMQALLGNCVQLHSATARVTQPGAPRPGLASRRPLAGGSRGHPHRQHSGTDQLRLLSRPADQ